MGWHQLNWVLQLWLALLTGAVVGLIVGACIMAASR